MAQVAQHLVGAGAPTPARRAWHRQPVQQQQRKCYSAAHGLPVVAWASAGAEGHLHHLQHDPLSRPEQLPLLSKRIIVTAPRQYAEKLSGKLVSAGARPLWVPGVAITALDDREHSAHVAALDRELTALMHGNRHSITHVAFTSKNGIHAVLQRLATLAAGPDASHAAGLAAAVDVLQRAGVRLCALGADGQVLLHAGLPVHVAPQEASTLGLVRELEQRGEARGARLLCPVPLVTGGLTEPSVVPRFLAALQAAGAHPVRAEAYVTTLGSAPEQCHLERAALEQGHVHAIAFSSTAEAQGLLQLMGGQRSVAAAVERHGVLLAAHGPYTAQGASQVLGLPVPCVSKSFSSFDGLVHALEEAFATPGAGRAPAPARPAEEGPGGKSPVAAGAGGGSRVLTTQAARSN